MEEKTREISAPELIVAQKFLARIIWISKSLLQQSNEHEIVFIRKYEKYFCNRNCL